MRLSAHFRERAAQLSLRPRRPPARHRAPISFSKQPFQLVKGQLWAAERATITETVFTIIFHPPYYQAQIGSFGDKELHVKSQRSICIKNIKNKLTRPKVRVFVILLRKIKPKHLQTSTLKKTKKNPSHSFPLASVVAFTTNARQEEWDGECWSTQPSRA